MLSASALILSGTMMLSQKETLDIIKENFDQVTEAVVSMCDKFPKNYVSPDGTVVYFVDEVKRPTFINTLYAFTQNKKLFKEEGDYVTYEIKTNICSLEINGYSILKEAENSFSVSLHVDEDHTFAIGFWTIEDYNALESANMNWSDIK